MLLARGPIADADVVVLVIDATLGAADQDGAIAGEAERAGRSIMIAVNKWDLVKAEGEDFAEKFDDKLRFELKFLDYRAHRPYLGADRGAHAEAARGDRQGDAAAGSACRRRS